MRGVRDSEELGTRQKQQRDQLHKTLAAHGSNPTRFLFIIQRV